MTVRVNLVIQKGRKSVLDGGGDLFYGSVRYNTVQETFTAESIEDLEELTIHFIQTILNHKNRRAAIQIRKTYDVFSFFQECQFLNISKLAESINMNPTLIQQYANGKKHASFSQLERIEKGVKAMAYKMLTVRLSKPCKGGEHEEDIKSIKLKAQHPAVLPRALELMTMPLSYKRWYDERNTKRKISALEYREREIEYEFFSLGNHRDRQMPDSDE